MNVAASSLAAAATDIRVERRDPRVDDGAAVSSCATADAAVDIRVDLRVLALRDVVVVVADADDALPLLRGVGSALELEFNDDFALLLPLPVVAAVTAVSLVRFPSGFRFLLPLRRAVLGGGGGGMSIESMLSNFSRTFSSCTFDMSVCSKISDAVERLSASTLFLLLLSLVLKLTGPSLFRRGEYYAMVHDTWYPILVCTTHHAHSKPSTTYLR